MALDMWRSKMKTKVYECLNTFNEREWNVLHVALDHMIEHLRDCIRDESAICHDDGEYLLEQCERLVSANKLRNRLNE